MTNTIEDATEDQITESNIKNNASSTPSTVPQEIMAIMEYLSRNPNITFKSQQRDEPELQQTEKLKVALDIYQRNPQRFLIRFGNFLAETHLQNFARLSIAASDEEMHQMVKDYQYKLKSRQRDTKNRRYTALQELIKEGEYFSEQEMMKRQPELYQELVGQYLSNKEKQQRDSYDVRNTTFSGILMHTLEQKHLNEIMEKAENNVKNEHVSEESSTLSDGLEKGVLDNLEKEDEEIPVNCRQQWGNFDSERIPCSSSKVQTNKSPPNKVKPVLNCITANERELLRQEFISQMYERFLTGQDKDFDYDTVDDNTQFDDLTIINQDKEDAYFEESDEDDIVQSNKLANNEMLPTEVNIDNESEDELDAYMFHLSKHHSLQS